MSNSALPDPCLQRSPSRGLCFARRTSTPRTTEFDRTLADDASRDIEALPIHVGAALATLLRFLLCGEESATHVFGDSLARSVTEAERVSLEAIAEEEAAHAWLIGRWIAKLPESPTAFDPIASRRFFRRLQTRYHALHFARIAALDALVCRILSRLIRGAALAPYPALRAGLARIRSDEIDHVRIALAHALRMDMRRAEFALVAADVEGRLAVLLAPAMPAMRLLTGADRTIDPVYDAGRSAQG
jgi:demethoxyubiquinone hydroxylase (CLK1/Coq7/Cat5 family)